MYAISRTGPERDRLVELADSPAIIEMSAVAWYELARGPRAAEQLAAARAFLGEDGILPFSEDLALRAAVCFRRLGSPRRRSADIAIGITATVFDARLLTRNARDFAGIPDLDLEEWPPPGSGD